MRVTPICRISGETRRIVAEGTMKQQLPIVANFLRESNDQPEAPAAESRRGRSARPRSAVARSSAMIPRGSSAPHAEIEMRSRFRLPAEISPSESAVVGQLPGRLT